MDISEPTKQLVGYSDELSVEPGQTVRFMVSCEGVDAYQAELVRIVHGDVNPAGPGFRADVVEGVDAQTVPGRVQHVDAGSYAVVPPDPRLDVSQGLTIEAMIWPTRPAAGRQAILGRLSADGARGYELMIDDDGALALLLGGGAGEPTVVSTGTPLRARCWYLVAATFDPASREVRLYQEPLGEQQAGLHAGLHGEVTSTLTGEDLTAALAPPPDAPLLIAARYAGERNGRPGGSSVYNGKIDRPRVAARALSRTDIVALSGPAVPAALDADVVAAWDFSVGIPTTTITDVSPNRLHGRLVNLPVRAVTGATWTADEQNWRHAPDQYGAIHFHDDDLYDAGWEPDFAVTLPDDLRSGFYAMRLHADGAEDYVPFFVRPGPGQRRADVLFVVPTASYLAYANERIPTSSPTAQLLTDQLPVLQPEDLFLARHVEYGGSTYDTHSDGSGVCYSSRLRPILNMRPKYASWLGGSGSSLWQYNADTHIVDWLESMGFEYDVVTDEDLHREGLDALAPYRVVLTGTHPEYTSTAMLDAYEAYLRRAGRLMYLGGNGFYWRIGFHDELPGVLEVRKAEGGTRAWAAEPGEYYHASNGEYGGLWRRNGRPPQRLVGTGFTAQGFDVSTYYRRRPGGSDARARFVFEGIGGDELIGDFGLEGGGAAGLELDRYDELLGSPPHALVLASSEGHTDVYLSVVEEILINHPAVSGTQSDLVRADLVFFETPSGGAVFSTSSIAWSGSLSHDGYDNNVSRLTANVLRRFLDPEPFAMP